MQDFTFSFPFARVKHTSESNRYLVRNVESMGIAIRLNQVNRIERLFEEKG